MPVILLSLKNTHINPEVLFFSIEIIVSFMAFLEPSSFERVETPSRPAGVKDDIWAYRLQIWRDCVNDVNDLEPTIPPPLPAPEDGEEEVYKFLYRRCRYTMPA